MAENPNITELDSEYEPKENSAVEINGALPGEGDGVSYWTKDDDGNLVPADGEPLSVGRVDNDDYHERVVTGNVSGTTALDLSAANFFKQTLTGNTTFEFHNPTADPAGNSLTLIVQQDSSGGHSITWPSSVQWDNGSAPSLSTNANDKHMLSFVSPDGGATWIGLLSAEAIA